MTFDEIFQYLESPPTIYEKEIFVFVDAVDEDGKVQFDLTNIIHLYFDVYDNDDDDCC